MKRYQVLLLIPSALLTGLAFWHDYLYDIPPTPYTPTMYVLEILIMGPGYIALFYAILWSAGYMLLAVFRRFKNMFRKAGQPRV